MFNIWWFVLIDECSTKIFSSMQKQFHVNNILFVYHLPMRNNDRNVHYKRIKTLSVWNKRNIYLVCFSFSSFVLLIYIMYCTSICMKCLCILNHKEREKERMQNRCLQRHSSLINIVVQVISIKQFCALCQVTRWYHDLHQILR